MMDTNELVGKKIIFAEITGVKDSEGKEYDDKPNLYLKMDDGSCFHIKSSFGGYTGNSEDEYPAFINVKRLQ